MSLSTAGGKPGALVHVLRGSYKFGLLHFSVFYKSVKVRTVTCKLVCIELLLGLTDKINSKKNEMLILYDALMCGIVSIVLNIISQGIFISYIEYD